jgi:hypothetical protein
VIQDPIFWIGIDPGRTGGITILSSDGDKPSIHPMPETEKDIWEMLKKFEHSPYYKTQAVIEKVGGYIGGGEGEKGGGAANGNSMFKFGCSYGGLRMALIGCGIPFLEVPPQTWQKHYGLIRTRTEKKNQFKSRMRAKAQQLLPSGKITVAVADSVLLALYCRDRFSLPAS